MDFGVKLSLLYFLTPWINVVFCCVRAHTHEYQEQARTPLHMHILF